MNERPNIVYMHSHDTGRYVQPYGYSIPTPNIQRLADQGILFRKAFCAAPTCSASRACLLTGQYGHTNGMLGLAHRGWSLNDYTHHIVHTLRTRGYGSALIGEQHISKRPDVIGYDEVVKIDTSHAGQIAPAADEYLSRQGEEPFFLSVGFFETHREFLGPKSVRDTLYALPPPNLPDSPETRRDMAAFRASARALDQGVGEVLGSLEAYGLSERTLIVFTTDHGIPFPGAKATLYDRGLGVMLIMRGPGGFSGGHVRDGLVSHIDIYPTLCEVVGAEPPEFLQGTSLMPLVRREADEVNEAIFAGSTWHAAYEPQRAVRTTRWKYIRRFADRAHPVLPNTDDGPSKDYLVRHGWSERVIPSEQLYDLVFDPGEAHNVAGEEWAASALEEMRGRLETWMAETADPLLRGPVEPPPGVEVNDLQGPIQMGPRGLPQPDFAVVHRDAYDGSHPQPEQTLLVIEVSETSLRYDRHVKLPLYARYGYPEAWIVDLAGEAIELHTGPSANGYRQMRRVGRGETVEAETLPGLALGVDHIVGGGDP